jgi:hypothetical protein
MSLLHLVGQSVVLKFTEAAKPHYDSTTGYVFRLTGVDGMGYLQLQDLRIGSDLEHETISEPYWINKDLVREIHEYASALGKDTLKYTGPAAKPEPREAGPRPRKAPKIKAAVL